MIEFSQQISAHAENLKQKAGNIAAYQLEQLPEADAQDIYERIHDYEADLASTDLSEDGYTLGTATVEDELVEISSSSASLITAEHATDHPRNGNRIKADHGTAGLGRVLHEDCGAGFIAPIGRQTGDANYDASHPLKDAVRSVMVKSRPKVLAGLHGFPRGKFASIHDTRAFDVILGIGREPNERSRLLAELVQKAAENLDLRVGINHPHIRMKNGEPILNDSGELTYMTLSAAGQNTLRSFEQRTAIELGYEPALVQVELSSLLRLTPENLDRKSRIMGTYLGYLIGKNILEIGTSTRLD